MILDIRGPDPQHYLLSEDDHGDETVKLGGRHVCFEFSAVSNSE